MSLYSYPGKMGSPLENIPSDVLQYIAILASSSSSFDPPVETLHLMQTGSVFYDALNIRSAPHVYARIFASKFDTAAPFRRYHSMITDSGLTSELVNRCRLLQRSKRGDVSARNLLKDLSTALWMYLESDGINEHQLLNVGFPDFILSVARIHLKGASSHDDQPSLIGKIIIWLLCLALSRRFIFQMPKHSRKELYALIFPYILSPEQNIRSFGSYPNCSSTEGCRCAQKWSNTLISLHEPTPMHSPVLDGGLRIPAYGFTHATYIPCPSTPAGNLASVIFESEPMKMPSHLQETRVMPVQWVQPTKSDFKAFAAYGTPLFADSLNVVRDSDVFKISGTPRSALHDFEFRHWMVRMPPEVSHPKEGYILGSMTAVWEGVFRTIDAPAGSSATDDMSFFSSFARPIQCALHEYVNEEAPATRHIEALSLSDIFLNEDGTELYARGCNYWRHDALKDSTSGPRIRDVMLHGETLENHDHAWGGYRFWGVVDEYGRVTLKRAAKEVDDNGSQGVWEFDGRLRFGSVLIGRWRMTGGSDNVYYGIFSMTRM